MSKILVLSGKKQAGKSTAMNFLFGLQMTKYGVIEGFRISDKGKLVVPYLVDDEIKWNIFEINRTDPAFLEWANNHVFPFVQNYSLAAPLKDFCINCFGLEYEQCYGTDEQKNLFTKLRWEDMPGVITMPEENQDENFKLMYHEPGYMTVREVLQYFGTEIVRSMRGDAWIEACTNRIQNNGPELAVIDDCRFPNEVFGLKDRGAIVVRLTRKGTDDDDQHESETALDPENFDWDNFDYVLDNDNMTIGEQNQALFDILVKEGIADMEFEVTQQ